MDGDAVLLLPARHISYDFMHYCAASPSVTLSHDKPLIYFIASVHKSNTRPTDKHADALCDIDLSYFITT